jgi:D-serine dehydratase
MAPQLFQMQLEAGAWGVTAATTWQVRVWRAFGAERIVLANELVEPASIRWIAGELGRDPNFDFYCLVDSVAAVRLLDATMHSTRASRPLQVLLEMGILGGRTGCRTRDEAREVAEAVKRAKHLSLAGVEGFEGIRESVEDVDPFLEDMRAVVIELDQQGFFAGRDEVLVTAGGSAFPDRVIEAFDGTPNPVHVVLRSGCYLTHDAVHYKRASPFGGRLAGTDPLQEALEIWGVVLSLPEPGLALLGFGKRDVPYDLELPVPRLIKRGDQAVRPLRGSASIKALNDQHAYMHIDDGDELAVGDMVGCGISHPCTAFDKWRLIPMVDDAYRVVDAILTYF